MVYRETIPCCRHWVLIDGLEDAELFLQNFRQAQAARLNNTPPPVLEMGDPIDADENEKEDKKKKEKEKEKEKENDAKPGTKKSTETDNQTQQPTTTDGKEKKP